MPKTHENKSLHVRFVIDQARYIEPVTEQALAKQEKFTSIVAERWAHEGTPKMKTYFVPRFSLPEDEEGLSIDEVVEHVKKCADEAAAQGYPTMSLCVEPGRYKKHDTLFVFAQNEDDEDSRVNSVPILWDGTVGELEDELTVQFCELGLLVQEKPDALDERRVFSMSLVTLDAQSEFCSRIVRLEEESRELERFGKMGFASTTRSTRTRRVDLGAPLK